MLKYLAQSKTLIFQTCEYCKKLEFGLKLASEGECKVIETFMYIFVPIINIFSESLYVSNKLEIVLGHLSLWRLIGVVLPAKH